jgi:hypothetical protein
MGSLLMVATDYDPIQSPPCGQITFVTGSSASQYLWHRLQVQL